MTRWHGGWAPGTWIAMAFVMLVFWTIVVGVVVTVVRSDRFHGAASSSPQSDAERILAERFARGEIDGDEYKLRRDLIRSS